MLSATLILIETERSHGTVSATSLDSSGTDPARRISKVESDGSNHPSMAEPRTFRVLVVAPGETPAVVHEAVTAVAAIDRICFDELHVFTSADRADRLRAVLLKSGTASALADRCRRLGIAKADILFGRRMIHALGGSGTPGSIADDALRILGKLCGESMTEVTVVASSDAGVVGILAHSAFQLVGGHRDRFFVLDVGPMAGDASTHRRRREGRLSRPTLFEVQTILAARPVLPSQSYSELAASRRVARRRLSQPGAFLMDGRRRAIEIDDVVLAVPRLQFFWLFCLGTLAPKALPLRSLCGNVDVGTDGRIAVASKHPHRADVEVVARHLGRVFAALFPDVADEFPSVFRRACGPSPGLPSVIAKLNAHLKRALGGGAEPYLIAGGRGAGGYRLTLPPAQITLVPHMRLAQTARQRAGG
jgi:hypothetical protein